MPTSRPPRSAPPAATPERESVLSLILRGLFWSALIALVLISWSPGELGSVSLSRLAWWRGAPQASPEALLPTFTPDLNRRVGIISGHWKNDAGATCPDGLEEMKVNHNIALRVQEILRQAGYQVDMLAEFDPRLKDYHALALVSIHADVCQPDPRLTGFKTAPAKGVNDPAQLENSLHLKRCLDARYAAATDLPYHPHSVSRHMTEHHAFNEIAATTPAVIIETGFLGSDRDLLVNHPDRVAAGIAQGILCYLRNEPITVGTPQP